MAAKMFCYTSVPRFIKILEVVAIKQRVRNITALTNTTFSNSKKAIECPADTNSLIRKREQKEDKILSMTLDSLLFVVGAFPFLALCPLFEDV